MKNLNLSIILFLFFATSFAQEKKNKLVPKKIGFLYNFGNENNFIIEDDKDYFYTTRTFKGQLFYDLLDYDKYVLELIVQPQYQLIKHQLLNKFFITPNEVNFEAQRERFTTLKNINLYALEFGFNSKIQLLKSISFDIAISLGFAFIDEETERLAKGFTFIENLSIGFTVKTSSKTNVYFGGNIGHLSNFEFQQPNSGYNIAGIEIGFQYILK